MKSLSETVYMNEIETQEPKTTEMVDVESNAANSEVHKNDVEEKYNLVGSKKILEKVFLYAACLVLAFCVGYSHTSYTLIINQSLEYSKDFFSEYHETFALLSPAFFNSGAAFGTLVLFSMRGYNHRAICIVSAALFLISNIMTSINYHIVFVFMTRVLLGIASGLASVIVPQLLYSLSPTDRRGFRSSFFPCSLLTGLTLAVALIPLASSYLIYIKIFQIVISLLVIPLFIFAGSLESVMKEYSLWRGLSYMLKASAQKSIITVILLHVFQKTTGVDFIGNFSASFFDGPNGHLHGLLPLVFAIVMTIATSFVPDIFGRKKNIVLCLFALGITTFTMGYFGTNLISLGFFIFFYNSGLNSIPYYYQNEVVKQGFEPMINEIGTLSSWILAIAVALFVTFFKVKMTSAIWYTFCVSTLLGFVVLSIIMIETQGISVTEKGFIQSWWNLMNWKLNA